MAKRQARKHSSHPCNPVNSVSPTEGTLEAAKRQQQDELIQEHEERERDEPPTVIPFPSEAAPAAADRPDPQATCEAQGDAGHANAAQRLWVSRALRKAAKKSRRKRDWGRFTFREKFTPQECLEREKANYRKGKLLSGQITQPPDTATTIIPFPSEEAQAAGSQPDHQEAGGNHGGGGKPGARQSSGTARTLRDWSQFTRVREKHTFEERIERKKRKYKQKLRRAKLARRSNASSIIIPFPSGQAQAAGKPAAPSSDA